LRRQNRELSFLDTSLVSPENRRQIRGWLASPPSGIGRESAPIMFANIVLVLIVTWMTAGGWLMWGSLRAADRR